MRNKFNEFFGDVLSDKLREAVYRMGEIYEDNTPLDTVLDYLRENLPEGTAKTSLIARLRAPQHAVSTEATASDVEPLSLHDFLRIIRVERRYREKVSDAVMEANAILNALAMSFDPMGNEKDKKVSVLIYEAKKRIEELSKEGITDEGRSRYRGAIVDTLAGIVEEMLRQLSVIGNAEPAGEEDIAEESEPEEKGLLSDLSPTEKNNMLALLDIFNDDSDSPNSLNDAIAEISPELSRKILIIGSHARTAAEATDYQTPFTIAEFLKLLRDEKIKALPPIKRTAMDAENTLNELKRIHIDPIQAISPATAAELLEILKIARDKIAEYQIREKNPKYDEATILVKIRRVVGKTESIVGERLEGYKNYLDERKERLALLEPLNLIGSKINDNAVRLWDEQIGKYSEKIGKLRDEITSEESEYDFETLKNEIKKLEDKIEKLLAPEPNEWSENIVIPVATAEQANVTRDVKAVFVTSSERFKTSELQTIETASDATLNEGEVKVIRYRPAITVISALAMQPKNHVRFSSNDNDTQGKSGEIIADLYSKIAEGFYLIYAKNDSALLGNEDFKRLIQFCDWVAKVGIEKAMVLLLTSFELVKSLPAESTLGGCPKITDDEKQSFIEGSGKQY